MITRARWALLAALVAAGATLLPPGAVAAPAGQRPSADLRTLTAQLAAVTAHAQELTDRLNEAAARDGGLRVAYSRLEDARTAAQLALDTRAREVYMAGYLGSAGTPIRDWQADLATPELRELARRGQRAALAVDQSLIDAVSARAKDMKRLQRQADGFRQQLMGQAQAVLADQDRARELLAQAQAVAEAQRAVEVLRQLAAQREALDLVSAEVTVALTPAQSRRSRNAQLTQQPVVALLESAGSAVPAGYIRTGQVVTGAASWYGPGFVGKPTASGSPYDPERATCAHKTLPLGTVLYVTRGELAVSCLVNDRGPYVGDRILDMSRAGSRALGYSGVAVVTIEVLVSG